MNGVLVGGLILVAVLVIWIALQELGRRKKEEVLETQVNELRRDLQTIATSQAQSTGQISAIAQNVTQRLESVTKTLQEGVTQSAQISAQSQAAMREELKNTHGMMERIQKQLGEFQELGRGLSDATQTLEGVLGGAKTRGILGEITLERLLEDALPSSQYSRQYRFSTGEIADAVIFLRDGKLLAVDSKFPLDAYRRIQTEGDEAKRSFIAAVKGHADSISRKYIVPEENTLDLALMFVPSEGVYYELLMSEDSKGQSVDAYCRERRIAPVSPNTLYAHLRIIAMGLRGMQIEENAKRLAAGLAGLQKQLDNFSDIFEKLGTHLKNAQQNYLEADTRLEKAQSTLGGMLEAGDGPQQKLPLQAASAKQIG
jgi:DNA recombination protein RmuC